MLGKKADIKVGMDFGTVPPDKYTVQIADVNFKTMFNKFKGVDEERLNFQFVILDDKKYEDDNGETVSTRGKFLWHAISQSLSTRSHLMKLAKAVYGRELTKEELNPDSPKFFDPEKIVGMQVDVMVTEEPNKDNTAIFNNIKEYMKSRKELEPYEVSREGQVVVEAETRSALSDEEDPLPNAPLDKFIKDIEEESEDDEEEEGAEEEESEEDEDEVEALKKQLAEAEAKAKKAKKANNAGTAKS